MLPVTLQTFEDSKKSQKVKDHSRVRRDEDGSVTRRSVIGTERDYEI